MYHSVQMSQPTYESAFLTASEAAQILRLSMPTIRKLILTGEIHAVRVGRAFRIPRAEFEATFGLTEAAS